MQINVPDPISQTIIFSLLLAAGILLLLKKSTAGTMTTTQTNQLKGLAILMVIFSHVGYFLSTDTRFLYPLSVAGGVGVNLFLFLSGYGLTISSIKNKLSIGSFYKKRLSRIFWPMWLVISILLLMDYFLLGINYPLISIIQSYLGFFPDAQIFKVLNSPLWYFTLILFYYLIFPLVFLKSKPLISSIIILAASFFLVNQNLPVDKDVLKLYKLHLLAFPLGMVFVSLLGWFANFKPNYARYFKYPLIIILTILIGFSAINSHVGEGIIREQLSSLVTMFSLTGLVLVLPIQSRVLILLGIYSYEIYLIQWPLMQRFDLLYKNMPAAFATIAYLILYVIIGLALHKVSSTYLKRA